MARIRPFRALRYDVPDLEAVVAPPYDVISEEERAGYLARSPYNVVHLTLPASDEQAARDLAAWQEEGVLVRDPEPSYWWLAQDYVGPDGVARRREGFIASLHAEPYESRVILPHERTHAGPKEGRLRLLRATRTQLEPLFFLRDGTIEVDGLGEPDLEVGGDKLGRLDAEIVDALKPEGVTYTPQRHDAIAAVDRGEAEAAFLLRPTRIEDVWEVAGRGDVMPQKSTFFYPKLTSGLLLHPLD